MYMYAYVCVCMYAGKRERSPTLQREITVPFLSNNKNSLSSSSARSVGKQ